jgi:signal transduction histidine kinase/ActR/RegA family two-component response regulator
MEIDIRTLYLVHGLVSVILAVLLAGFWRTQRGIGGLGWWTAASALLGFALLAGALRGLIPDFVSIVLGNAAITLNIFCYWNGIRRFDGRPARWAGPIAITIAVELFTLYHHYVIEDSLSRIVVISLVLAAGCALCTYELIRGPARTLRGTALTAAALFGALGLTLIGRALSTALGPRAPAPFVPGPVQTVYLLTLVVGSILIVITLLMMALQRLQRRVEARSAELDTALATAEARARELAESRQQLAVAHRLEAMGQLTGGVAHDFNNLLTVVAGSVEMITRGARDWSRVEKLAETALRAVSRGQQLTESLLTFARRDVVRPEIVQPSRLVAEFEGLLRRATGERIALSMVLSPDAHPVRIDPSRFEVAVLNLVLNARDAIAGSGHVVIEVANAALDDAAAARHPDAKPGPYVVIAVRDDGAGMAAEVAAQAFEPFFTTKEVGKGSGLGLSQVYGFARGAGGHVTIESRLGAGTTIRLHLPRSEQAAPAATLATPAPAARAPRPVRGDETVLIVEDDLLVLAAVAESIATLGYRTLAATTAQEALVHLRDAARIDLLFSDVVLAGNVDGLQLASQARQLRPDLKVLLTSGYPGTIVGALPDDLDIIAKPYRWDQLAAKLRQAIGDRAAPPAAAAMQAASGK